jgi:hypothetical protein
MFGEVDEQPIQRSLPAVSSPTAPPLHISIRPLRQVRHEDSMHNPRRSVIEKRQTDKSRRAAIEDVRKGGRHLAADRSALRNRSAQAH